MKKISTLFKKDPNDLSRVINEIAPKNEWAINDGIATRKYDGTACAIIDSELYKRFDLKPGRSLPDGAIPCQEADAITGHHPHWVPCKRNDKGDKYHFEAFDKLGIVIDGTYELCGPKVQSNPEKFDSHYLIPHGGDVLIIEDRSFEGIKRFLEEHDIEGIVFHGKNKEMCKIRAKDFGIKR